jgi:hypothetical protein
MLTKTNTVATDFVEQLIVSEAGRTELQRGLQDFGVTLPKFGEMLTKTNTVATDFIRKYVVNDAGRVDLAIGCAHFGLTLFQMGILLLQSSFKSGFVQQYIVDRTKWYLVKRLDKFTKADLDLSRAKKLGNPQTPTTRLVDLSKMQHQDRPQWSDTHTHTHIFNHACTYMSSLCCVALLFLGCLCCCARWVEGRFSLFTL